MASDPPPRGPEAGGGDSDPGKRYTGRARVGPPAGSQPVRSAPVRVGGSGQSAAAGPREARFDPRGLAAPPALRPPPKKRRPRWGRIAFVALALIAVIGGAGLIVSYLWVKGVDDHLKREDPFSALEGRPPKLVDGTLNVLLLGTDSRDPGTFDGVPGCGCTDTIVIMHIPASHDRAYLVSIPRDTYVEIPGGRNGGSTHDKINSAFQRGGMSLMVETVENFTGVRMDHVALVDFGGFIQVTDAVGGVDMNVDEEIVSIHPPYRRFLAGEQHFTGDEALDYVRQRYQFSDGDFSRIRHQQMFLKALLDKAVSVGTLTSINSLRNFVTSVADSMTVDRDFSLIDLAWQFHSLRSEDLTFLTNPSAGYGNESVGSVVYSDDEAAGGLYEAMSRDTVGDWIAQNGTITRAGR